MTATAVIPHWNRRELLETLLPNLRQQSQPFDEIIVVDNGSTDDSASFAEQHGARVIRLAENRGFAAAVNCGIQAAQSEWIAILNNDVTLESAWLATLIHSAQQASADFAAGKILRAGDPSIIDGTFDEVSRGACACRCGSGRPDSPFWNRPRPIRIAPMTAALFRRRLFEEIGRLDERFISYLEDTDFGIRCALAGRSGVYDPLAIAHHRGSSTLGAWSSDTVRAIARNQILLAIKHFQGQPRWPIVAGQLLWGLLAFRHARGLAYLAGRSAGRRAAGLIEQNSAPDAVKHFITASENEILDIQRQTGFDTYWKAYFRLVRP